MSLKANNVVRKCPVAHRQPTQETIISPPRECPVSHIKKVPPKYEDLEKDFTTKGKPSSLECPFAKMTKNGLPPGLDEKDPIAAEFHADVLSAHSLDDAKSCGRCPIRFLDKHSPEELAEYFEKHKHELPRSHEICVKRYQQNEVSIRQLDAKYGSLVSMIQGLGNKHKQYLPDEQGPGSGTDQRSGGAVEQWALNVDEDTPAESPPLEDEHKSEAEDEQRISHFNKPLREVRVGESPSRPWGIHVPQDRPKAESAHSSIASPQKRKTNPPVISPIPLSTHTTSKGKSTFSVSGKATSRTSNKSKTKDRGNIIFNGPVFIGYPPDQAAAFLAQLRNTQDGNDTQV